MIVPEHYEIIGSLVFFFAVLSIVVIILNAIKYMVFPKRFGKVEDGLYRSGQIHQRLIEKVLKKYNINSVVALNENELGDPKYVAEQDAVKRNGISFNRFQLIGDGTGDFNFYIKAVEQIVKAKSEDRNILVHCAAGAQRTGGTIAFYQLLVKNESPKNVYKHMRQYGWKDKTKYPLLGYINENIANVAEGLQKNGVLSDVPNPLPFLKSKHEKNKQKFWSIMKNKFIQFLNYVNFDLIYKWATFFIIPFFIVFTSFKNEIFFFYLFLAILKILKNGYKKSGLEYAFCIAMIGLLISSLDEGGLRTVKDCLRVARIISLPILMYQFKPIKELKRYFILLFGLLATYGLIRLNVFPIVKGYSDRAFCFADFYMNSSVIAFSGYLFFLVLFLKSKNKITKIMSLVNVAIFMYLIVIHGVRASYVTFLLVTPFVLCFEMKKQILKFIPFLLVGLIAVTAVFYVVDSNFTKLTKDRVASIFDMSQGSNRGRLCIWSNAIKTFKDNPVNGVGYKRFNKTNFDLDNQEFQWAFWHAHNEMLAMLAETGLIGTVTWLVFKLQLLLLLFKRRQSLLGAFILYFFIAFEVHNYFEVYLFERTTYIYVYLLIGACFNFFGGELLPKPNPASCE